MKTQLTGMKGDRTTKTETLAPLLEALLEETQAASGAARAAELELETEMEELLYQIEFFAPELEKLQEEMDTA